GTRDIIDLGDGRPARTVGVLWAGRRFGARPLTAAEAAYFDGLHRNPAACDVGAVRARLRRLFGGEAPDLEEMDVETLTLLLLGLAKASGPARAAAVPAAAAGRGPVGVRRRRRW